MTSAADLGGTLPFAVTHGAIAGEPRRAYLIAGAGGTLGTALRHALSARGARYVAPRLEDFDITDPAEVALVVASFVETLAPAETGVLLNAAAYTDVERAEDEAELAYRVNEHGSRVLAHAAHETGLRFVHVSTDFVFDGAKGAPYAEDDEPNPLSVYGASKLAGERAVFSADPQALVIRTAWLYGTETGFPPRIVQAAASRPTLSVVDDETGSPTYVADLAVGLLALEAVGASGIFHLAGAGSCSRYELALAALEAAGVSGVEVAPVASDAYPTRATRPRDAALDCAKAAALGVTMPPWDEALARWAADAAL